MLFPIVLCSKSTMKYKGYYEKKFAGRNIVVGIGGGGIIDKAKIAALPKRCVAVPTTAAGASETTHAVVWAHSKFSIPTPKPMTEFPNFQVKLSKKARENTTWDCYAHIHESLCSVNRTKESIDYCHIAGKILNKLKTAKVKNDTVLITAGMYAGKAIEITGTNFVHAVSYAFTLLYNIPHGEACKYGLMTFLGSRLPLRRKFDFKLIAGCAMEYNKIHESTLGKMTENKVYSMLEKYLS